MVDREIIEEWITKADEDFEFARINLEEDKPFYAQICFHFQQAVEKYLKAYLIAKGLKFRKIHDLPLLLKQCASKDPTIANFSEDCEYLVTFYIEARYPVHWPVHLSKKEAEKAYRAAEKISIFFKEKLGYKAKPIYNTISKL
jgi:HEPN domain-containing protein